jgi:transposase-like protein
MFMSKEIAVISASKKQSFSETEKRRIVEESKHSSLSLNKFAKKCGISSAALSIWRRRYKTNTTTAIITQSNHSIASPVNFDDIISENSTLKFENEKLKNTIKTLYATIGQKVVAYEMREFS